MFNGGSVIVRGKEVVESDSWAKAVVHIDSAKTNETRNSGGRNGFRYRCLEERPSPPYSNKQDVMFGFPLSCSFQSYRCRLWVLNDKCTMLIDMKIIH